MLEAAIGILAAPHASSASRDATLSVLEALLDLEPPLQVETHCQSFLSFLHEVILQASIPYGRYPDLAVLPR